MESEILTADQLAEKLQIKAETVKIWARRGLIPAIRPTQKVLRFSLREVLDTIQKNSLTARSLPNDTGNL